ncbi:MAG: M20/M25/M40 family metallo-hydrolase [Spirochaetaceae bacterium]|nr:M20/M25/M40 family metallo-hydrolase [Spirochaetaceae bacterium]
MKEWPRSIRALRELVAIPSVNPMGRDDLPAEIVGEQAIAEHVAGELARLGLDAALVGRGGRTSVVAEARAGAGAETLLVASHLDTVPVDGMEIDPFDPVVEGDRVFGRGACDTKAGMAALLAALFRVLERGRLRRNLIVVGEADEELRSVGVADVLAHLGDRRPDWVLATEPTELRVIHAHKGVVHARLRAQGRACHSSDPGAGRNAIVLLARAILAIERDAAILATRPHPTLGPATLSIGVIRGGQAPNIVPDEARVWVDRRTLPEERVADVRAQLEATLRAEGLVGEVVVEACTEEKPPLETPRDARPIHACLAALESVGRPGELDHVAFGTDAGVFARAGVPSVVLGPGSISLAHTARESVPIDEVETMVRIFERLLEGEAPLRAPGGL